MEMDKEDVERDVIVQMMKTIDDDDEIGSQQWGQDVSVEDKSSCMTKFDDTWKVSLHELLQLFYVQCANIFFHFQNGKKTPQDDASYLHT